MTTSTLHTPVHSLDAEALRLLDAGISVIPVAANGTKAPAGCVKSWKEFQTRRMTETEAETMFRGNVGLAIISGAVSGNLECLDFDEPGLYEQFEQAADDNGVGDLVRGLPLVETPTGGAHLRYRCEESVEGNQKIAMQTFSLPESVAVEGKGNQRFAQIGPKKYPVVTVNGENRALKCVIETRGEGGYAIAPPSPAACHELNCPYVLLRGDLAVIPVISPADVQTLHNLARLFHEYEEPAQAVVAPPRETRERMEGTLPGEDFDNRDGLGAALDLLQGAGWKARTHGNGWHLTRPGKTKGISATLNIVPNCLYVFSPNAAPFDGGGTYSPFAVYARLKHDGDFSEAARALYNEGYGERIEWAKENRPLLMRPPAAIEQDAVLTFEQWQNYGRRLSKWKSRCDDEFRWQAGDWWNAKTVDIPHGEKRKYLRDLFATKSKKGEKVYSPLVKQVVDAASVCNKWPVETRFPELPFWWHTEIAGQTEETRKNYAEAYRAGTCKTRKDIRNALHIPDDPPREKTPWQLLRDQFPEKLCNVLLKASETQEAQTILRKIEAMFGGGYDPSQPPAQHLSDGELIEDAALHVRQLEAAQQEEDAEKDTIKTGRIMMLIYPASGINESDFKSQNDGFDAQKNDAPETSENEDFSAPLELLETEGTDVDSPVRSDALPESLSYMYTKYNDESVAPNLPVYAVVSAAPVLPVPPAPDNSPERAALRADIRAACKSAGLPKISAAWLSETLGRSVSSVKEEYDSAGEEDLRRILRSVILFPFGDLLSADFPDAAVPPITVPKHPAMKIHRPAPAVLHAVSRVRAALNSREVMPEVEVLSAVQDWWATEKRAAQEDFASVGMVL